MMVCFSKSKTYTFLYDFFPTYYRLKIYQVLLFNVWRVIEKKKPDIFSGIVLPRFYLLIHYFSVIIELLQPIEPLVRLFVTWPFISHLILLADIKVCSRVNGCYIPFMILNCLIIKLNAWITNLFI